MLNCVMLYLLICNSFKNYTELTSRELISWEVDLVGVDFVGVDLVGGRPATYTQYFVLGMQLPPESQPLFLYLCFVLFCFSTWVQLGWKKTQ